MAIKSKSKNNYLLKELFTKKYKNRVVKPKKGKGSYNRKKAKV
ncbi:alternative ribosome rescue factor ArfA [Candidatus Pelagibacter sp.]|nr:alternative ribosome rescue factor ArfA [Candidatus Pelagibacter sp.]